MTELETELQYIKKQTETLAQAVLELKEISNILLTIVRGHQYDDESGMISKIKEHETRITKIETIELKRAGIFIVVGFILSWIGFNGFRLLNKLL